MGENPNELSLFGMKVTLEDFETELTNHLNCISENEVLQTYKDLFLKLQVKCENLQEQLNSEKQRAQNESYKMEPKRNASRTRLISTSIGGSRLKSSTTTTPLSPFLRGITRITQSTGDDMPSLYQIFSEGYTIILPTKYDAKNDSNRKSLKLFSDFLRKLRLYKENIFRKLAKKNSSIPKSFWVNTFHKYLEQNTVGRISLQYSNQQIKVLNREEFKDFLTSLQMNYFVNVLTNFLSIECDTKSEEDVGIAVELLDFYKRYTIDPYSSLVGFAPSKKVISQLTPSKKLTRGALFVIKRPAAFQPNANQNMYHFIKSNLSPNQSAYVSTPQNYNSALYQSSSNPVLTSSFSSTPPTPSSSNSNNNNATTTSSNTINTINNNMNNLMNNLINNLNPLNVTTSPPSTSSASLSTSSSPDLNPQDYIYCRWANQFANNVDVYINISQNVTISVDSKDCFFLSDDIENEIVNCEVSKFGKFIENPFDEFYRNLVFVDAQEAIYKYLQTEQNINMTLITNNKNLLSDSYELHQTIADLTSIISSVPPQLLSYIEEIVNHKLFNFITSNDPDYFFKPTFLQSFREITDVPIVSTQATIRRLIGFCKEKIDQLKLNKRDLLTGDRKNELVNWWLNEIRDATNTFLIDLKFQLDAIPNNYCDQPPANLDFVKQNMAILRSIINPTSPHYDPSKMMEELKLKIYPEIDTFLLDSKAVLSAEFGSDVRELNTAQLKALFKEKSSSIEDPHLVKWIDGTIKDIEYLFEMKMLEDVEYAKEHPSFHIVPVSGLVMSTFIRLENEHKTVLELWAPKSEPLPLPPPLTPPPPIISTTTPPASSSNSSSSSSSNSSYVSSSIKESSRERRDNSPLPSSNISSPSTSKRDSKDNNPPSPHSQSTPSSNLGHSGGVNLVINNNNGSGGAPNDDGRRESVCESPDVSQSLDRMFISSILDGKIRTAETILDKLKSAKSKRNFDFDVNRKDPKYGWTVLHCAASEGLYKLCRTLLKMFSSEINVNVVNNDGNTALHYVVRHRTNSEKETDLQVQTIKKLISMGANVNLQNNGGETALHAACLRGNYKASVLLLNANANPNYVTKDNHETCLHYAIRSRATNIVSKLVDAGVDVSAVSIFGETAMDIAIKMNSEPLITALRSALLNSYK